MACSSPWPPGRSCVHAPSSDALRRLDLAARDHATLLQGDRRSRVAKALWVLATLVIGLLALAAIDLLRIKADLDTGQASLRAIDFNTVDEHGGLVPVASDADTHLARAAARANESPWLDALSYVPGVDAQVRGRDELAPPTAGIALARPARHPHVGTARR